MLKRRDFLSALPGVAWQNLRRPNILLLLTDQQISGGLSAAGNRWLQTPAMDSIAASGVRFERAYCPYPVCSPSRGSLFTGRMPHETGVRTNGKAIMAGMPTMGEVFRSAGYETVYGGKWHLPKSFDGMTGFEKLAGGSQYGKDMDAPLASACDTWLRNRPKSNDPFLMVASFMNPHDVCEWIRAHPGAREHPNVDRYPAAPANLAIDPLEPDAMRYHRTAGYDLMSQGVGIASEWKADDFREYRHDYFRMIEAVDREIGRVLAALQDSGAAANTTIVFASDHGEGFGGHRWVQKASFYEESVGVPLIISGARVSRRGRVDSTTLANLTDILPTVCDIAGIPSPRDVRGRSLLAALEGKKLGARPIVSELRYGGPEREGRMLLTSRYKYIRFNDGDRREQFFDRQADPGEIHNLVADTGKTGIISEHREMLSRWLADTGDDFPR